MKVISPNGSLLGLPSLPQESIRAGENRKVHWLLERRPQRTPRAHSGKLGEEAGWVPGLGSTSLPRTSLSPLPPSLSTRGLGSSFSGRLAAGSRQGKDIRAHGLAQYLAYYSLSASKSRTRGPGNPGLRAASRNSCLSFSSSRRETHGPPAGQTLTALSVPGMAPESPQEAQMIQAEAEQAEGGSLKSALLPRALPSLDLKSHHKDACSPHVRIRERGSQRVSHSCLRSLVNLDPAGPSGFPVRIILTVPADLTTSPFP